MKLTHGKLIQQQDWADWQSSEYLQLINTKNMACLARPSRSQKTIQYFIWCGLIISKRWMDKRRLVASAMGLHDQAKFKSLLRRTQNAWTKQALACSIPLQLQRISSSTVRTYQMPLQKPHHQNRVSISVLTAVSPNGGFSTKPNIYSSWLCHPCPLCNAGPPEITPSLGQARQRDSLQNWPHTHCARALLILGHYQRSVNTPHATSR